MKIIIDTPKFSFKKYKDDGTVDYASPIPCPFNYGSIPNTVSGDGDRQDAIVLGKKVKGEVESELRGIVNFLDEGKDDAKWICSANPITFFEKLQLLTFFHVFGLAKKVLNRVRGKKGETAFIGIEIL